MSTIISGSYTSQIKLTSTLTIGGTVASGETIIFTGTKGVVNIQHAGQFAGTIHGQGPTDQVNISSLARASVRRAASCQSRAISTLATAPTLPTATGRSRCIPTLRTVYGRRRVARRW